MRFKTLETPSKDKPLRVLFLYLGRRGALGRFILELAEAACRMEELCATFAISRQNELASRFSQFSTSVLYVDTFARATPWSITKNFFVARRQLVTRLERDRPFAVITLMPHMWTPLLAPTIQKLGILYATVIHDAVGHPGDPTARVIRWLRSEARSADLVVTLSRAVADQLTSPRGIPIKRILPLFHPDLHFGSAIANRTREANTPLKLLFFGRILGYKSVPTLIEAIEMLQAEGTKVHLGIFGSGDIRKLRPRLDALGAEVNNRWIEDDDVPSIFARYDAVVLPHLEASQSGVAAIAFANCVPVVGMPVGGIPEQLDGGRKGVLAERANARSLADAINRLAVDTALYERISRHLSCTFEDRSFARFIDEVVSEIMGLDALRDRCGLLP